MKTTFTIPGSVSIILWVLQAIFLALCSVLQFNWLLILMPTIVLGGIQMLILTSLWMVLLFGKR